MGENVLEGEESDYSEECSESESDEEKNAWEDRSRSRVTDELDLESDATHNVLLKTSLKIVGLNMVQKKAMRSFFHD